MAELVLMGTSHRTSTVEAREQLAFSAADLPRALGLLHGVEAVQECLILSTCNRVELYAVMKTARPEVLRDFLGSFHGRTLDDGPSWYERQAAGAISHLCRVCAGLDSLVLGEPEVFGQVKEAYRQAQEAATVGEYFRVLFPLAFSLVKKIRHQSGIGRSSVSVSGVAVQMAREIFAELAERRVLVLGAGEMGEQVAKSLRKEGAAEVLVANRTFSKAVQLAEQISGTPIMLHEALEYLSGVDIVISSLNSADFVFTSQQIGASLRGTSRPRPLLLIDIAVPRSIDPAVGRLAGLHLYNIDDLTSIADVNAEGRRKEAVAAERMIEAKAGEIIAKCEKGELRRTFRDIRSEAERIRQASLENAIPRLNVSEEDRLLIDSLTRSIVSGILRSTMVRLQDPAPRMRTRDGMGT